MSEKEEITETRKDLNHIEAIKKLDERVGE